MSTKRSHDWNFSIDPTVESMLSSGCPVLIEHSPGHNQPFVAAAVLKHSLVCGTDVLWTRVSKLCAAESFCQQPASHALLETYTAPGILLVSISRADTYATNAANALLHVIEHRARARRPTIVLTDAPVSAWSTFLSDECSVRLLEQMIVGRGARLRTDGALPPPSSTPTSPEPHDAMNDADASTDVAAQPPPATGQRRLSYGPLSVDLSSLVVEVDGMRRTLQPLQRRMLVYMISNLHRAVTRGEFLINLWESTHSPSCSNVRRQIHGLRRALGPAGYLIETHGKEGWGIGLGLTATTRAVAFRFECDAQDRDARHPSASEQERTSP